MRTVYSNGVPVAPGKIVCVGRNYAAHARELGNAVPDELVIFLKPNSAIGDGLFAESGGEPLHYEAELAFMVQGARLHSVALGLDLTKRALQQRLKDRSLPWEKAKAFDGATLFSHFVPFDCPLEALSLELDVEGSPRQRGGVTDMLFSPETILSGVKEFMTLEDGDILMTGTPEGVGPVHAGEHFAGRVLAGPETLLSADWRAEAPHTAKLS